MRDLYADLGLGGYDYRASYTELRLHSAYRSAVKGAHPDRGGNAEAFQRVQEAWDVLGDPERRKRYDETGEWEGASATPPDPLLAAAMEAIADTLNKVLADEGVDLARTDVVDLVMRTLMFAAEEADTRLQSHRHQRERTVYLHGRLRPVKGVEGIPYGAVLARRLATIDKHIDAAAKVNAAMRKAVELVRQTTYEFTANPFDRKAPQAQDFYDVLSLMQLHRLGR